MLCNPCKGSDLHLFYSLNEGNALHVFFQCRFNSALQCHVHRWTSYARALETDRNHSLFINRDKFDISAIKLNGWADKFDYFGNLVEEITLIC